MNSDIGELLREGIERATVGERLHPSLAGAARQRHHRRALTVRATAVTGTAAVAAAVFAATIGASGTPQRADGELPAQTTAYVFGHTERALAAAGRGSLIQRDTSTLDRDATGMAVYAAGIGRKAHTFRLSSLTAARTTSWNYLGRTRMRGFTADGHLAFDLGPSTATTPGGPQPAPRTIVVDPNAGKWFHPLRLPDFWHPGRPTCFQGVDWLAAGSEFTPSQMSALIGKAQSCHLFRAAGRQRVDGVDALRFTATPRLARQLRGEAADVGPGVTLWVNPKTFLPVRLVLGRNGGSTDFGWLKPTQANLAMLRVSVPAGLREVRLPAGHVLTWALPAP